MENYSNITLDTIKQAGVLTTEDFNVLSDLKEELKDVFLYSQVFRTRTEMEVSILNDLHYPTPDAKYWQAMREHNVMFQELVNLSYEYRQKQVELKILQRDLDKEEDELQRELLQIKIERTQFAILNQERVAKDRIREIREWHEIKKNLLPQMKYSLVDVNEHQLISYTQRWINEALTAGENGSPSEMSNLYGQLHRGIKVCMEKGLLEKVLEPYSTETRSSLKQIYANNLLEKEA